MRILIFGADGMLGHKLFKHFSVNHETYGTLHGRRDAYSKAYDFFGLNVVYGLDVRVCGRAEAVIESIEPNVVINACGLVKQRKQESTHDFVAINAMLPHRLANACHTVRARFVQISTDCVFSGWKGSYVESDQPDPVDLYGRSKLLGEITDDPECLTIRTSIIGTELRNNLGLVEWFLAQKTPTIPGYTNAFFSGFTTQAFAQALDRILEAKDAWNHSAFGLWHLSSDRISKYDLLVQLGNRVGRTCRVTAASYGKGCDRSLDSSAIRKWIPRLEIPTWPSMLDILADEIKRRQ